jgi:hypothetical protein
MMLLALALALSCPQAAVVCEPSLNTVERPPDYYNIIVSLQMCVFDLERVTC